MWQSVRMDHPLWVEIVAPVGVVVVVVVRLDQKRGMDWSLRLESN